MERSDPMAIDLDGTTKRLTQKGVGKERIKQQRDVNGNMSLSVDGKKFLGGSQPVPTAVPSPTQNQQAYGTSGQQPAQQGQQVPIQQANPYQGEVFTPAEQNMSWQERLPYYAQNPEAGQAELQRATQAAGVYDALGDQERLQKAQHYIGQLNKAMGVNPNASPQDTQIQQINDYLNEFMTQSKTFDPYSSPEYAAQKAMADQRAQEQMRNTQEMLGGSNLARSTRLTDRVQDIAGDKEQYLQTQVLPQIIAQEQARKQQEFQNYISMLTPLQQQQIRADQQERFGIEDQRYEEETERQIARDAIADEQAKLEFDEDVRRWGIEEATDRAYKKGQLDISRYNAQTSRQSADTSAGNAQVRQLMDVWEKTGSAPEGLQGLGIEPGTPLPQEGLIDITQEKQGLTNAIRTGQITPGQALQQIEQDTSLGFYTADEAAILKQMVSQLAGFQDDQPKTPEEQQMDQMEREQIQTNLPSDQEIRAEAMRLGYPTIDYTVYYKSPKGKSAGLTFEQYTELHGPELKAR